MNPFESGVAIEVHAVPPGTYLLIEMREKYPGEPDRAAWPVVAIRYTTVLPELYLAHRLNADPVWLPTTHQALIGGACLPRTVVSFISADGREIVDRQLVSALALYDADSNRLIPSCGDGAAAWMQDLDVIDELLAEYVPSRGRDLA